MCRSGLLSLTLASTPLSNFWTHQLTSVTRKRGRVLTHHIPKRLMKTGDSLRRKNSASPSKGCFKRELKPSTQFAYWATYTHTICCFPPASYQILSKRSKGKRKIQGTRKTTYGWAQKWGEYCHWRAALSWGMFAENAGHKSPRKQTSLGPLLREQLVCLCNYCTCIYPSSHADAGLCITALFSICTVVLCDLIILRKWSQTSK